MRARNRGFTLLEILVAMTVLAIAMAAVIKTLGAQARNSEYLELRTLASWVAQNKAAEFQLSKQWPGTGEQNGSAQFAGRDWQWDTRVTNTEDPNIRRLDVRVSQDKKTVASVIAYLGQPK